MRATSQNAVSPLGRRLVPALVIASGIALAGCSSRTTPTDPVIPGALAYDGYRSRHPIVLTEQAETLDVPVGSQSVRLTSQMADTVAGFGAEALARGASGVTVMVPSGSANETAAHALSRQVTAALGRGGVPAHAVSYQPYSVPQSAADAPIRLAYPRVTASVPHKCGTWPAQVMGQTDNSEYYNFGCATQANLAAMVANPSDLVTPQGMTPADATRRTTVVRKYRDGAPTKSEQSVTKQTIANVGG